MRSAFPFAALLFLTGATCEPPPSGAPSNGAWTVSFTSPDPMTCPIAGHTVAVGTVDASTYGPMVSDGAGGALVSCETIDEGNARFTVHARIEQSGNVLEVEVAGIGSGSVADSPATADVHLTDLYTVDELVGDDCYAWFADGTGQAVQGGRAWFSFSCSDLTGPAADGCALPEGYLVVTDCAVQ